MVAQTNLMFNSKLGFSLLTFISLSTSKSYQSYLSPPPLPSPWTIFCLHLTFHLSPSLYHLSGPSSVYISPSTLSPLPSSWTIFCLHLTSHQPVFPSPPSCGLKEVPQRVTSELCEDSLKTPQSQHSGDRDRQTSVSSKQG